MDADTRRNDGYVLIWALVISALAGAIGCAALWYEGDSPGAGEAGLLCSIGALVGVAIEFRRDSYEASRLTGFLAITVAALGGLALFLEGVSLPGLEAGVLVLAGVAFACFRHAWRFQRGEDPLRNPLLERFEGRSIRETDGVQFVAWSSADRISAGEMFRVEAMAQNGWSEPRTFAVKLRNEFIGKRSAVAFAKEASVELGPGEAALITIPVARRLMFTN